MEEEILLTLKANGFLKIFYLYVKRGEGRMGEKH